MLRVNETGGVSHIRPIAHHAIQKPSEKQAQDAFIKIVAHLAGIEADKCDAEIDTLRRFLCIPS